MDELKPCPYCNPETPGAGTDIHRGNQLNVGYGVYREINYCPMCGGKLNQIKITEDEIGELNGKSET